MYDYRVQLNKIKNDRQSGSLQILDNTLRVIQEALSVNELNIGELKLAVVKLSSEFPDFGVLYHFITGINNSGSTKKEIAEFISDYKLKWGNVDQDISLSFLSNIDLNDKKILLHSNSKTIHTLFEEISKRNLKVDVFQTESHPGREGVLQAEYLGNFGFKVFVIKDDDVINYINKIDMFLIGADRIGPENVINKVGSSVIAKLFYESGKSIFVLADSRKLTQSESAVASDLFEKIPRNLIHEIFTENGRLSQ